jgi:hypothetical protein
MTRLQSWLTFGAITAAVVALYLLGLFEYVPFVGDNFSTGPVIARIAILVCLVLFLLVVARALTSLRTLRAEREEIDRASLMVDEPQYAESDEGATRLVDGLPRDGLLASRVDLLRTYLSKKAKTDEVCLLLARQSGLDNEYGDLVFGAEMVLIGAINLTGLTAVLVLLSEVLVGMFEAVNQTADFRSQAASVVLPLIGSIVDVMLVIVVLSGLARLLVRIPQRRQRLAIIAADELALYIMSKSKQMQSERPEDQPDLFAGMEISEAVSRAFAIAIGAGDPDSPLQSAALLVGLARADSVGRWDRIELEVGELNKLPYERYLDPAPSADVLSMSWGATSLSDTLSTALKLCDTICRTYEMSIVHPGVVALALVADPQSGAARCVLRLSKSAHDHLVQSIQDDLIGRRLDGIDSLLRQYARAAG